MGRASIRNHGVTIELTSIAEKQRSKNCSSRWMDVAIFCKINQQKNMYMKKGVSNKSKQFLYTEINT